MYPTASLQSSGSRALSQQARVYPVKVNQLSSDLIPIQQKRPRHLRKNPFNNFYKETPQSFKAVVYNKILDGFLLLDICKVDMPNQAVRAKLQGEGIAQVVQEDLKYFTNLSNLDLSDNSVRIEKLSNLESLNDLNLMCNNISSIPPLHFPAFRFLQNLNLSYNTINANSIIHLSTLPRLKILDLSQNKLCALPEDFSNFKSLRELSIASNGFNTDSVLFSASTLFKALSSIPLLGKLDISRNKLRGIHFESLKDPSFVHLRDLDFSYNWVDNQQDLMYASKFQALLYLNVTGNPFAQARQTDELESLLSTSQGASLINEMPFKKKQKAPYARPIAYITQDYTAALRNQLFGVDLANEMDALPISEINSTHEEQDVFPKAIEGPKETYKDIYTPSNQRGSSRPTRAHNRQFFLTEAEGKQKEEEATSRNKLDEFRDLACELLGKTKEYDKAVDLQTAYRQLRHLVKHPITYQTKGGGPKYTQSTISRNTYNAHNKEKISRYAKPPLQRVNEQIQHITDELVRVGQLKSVWQNYLNGVC